MITDSDIKRQVTDAIRGTGNPELYSEVDIDGVVRDIVAAYGHVDIGTVDEAALWRLISRQDTRLGDGSD